MDICAIIRLTLGAIERMSNEEAAGSSNVASADSPPSEDPEDYVHLEYRQVSRLKGCE